MDNGKLKNIVILILLLLNLAFGSLLLIQRMDEAAGQAQTRTELIQVLKGLGVSLEAELPQESNLYLWELSRDLETEANLCMSLLGTGEGQDQGGNIWYYENENGWAWFRGGGSFELLLKNAGLNLEQRLQETGIGAVREKDSYICRLDGVPVFNCRFTPGVRDGGIYLSGRVLTGKPERGEAVPEHDGATLLLRFHDLVQASGGVYSAIEEITSGYMLINTAAGMELTPVWQLRTNGGTWYLSLRDITLVSAG